jgi:cytochrome d ubiquinol oxidase subunit I
MEGVYETERRVPLHLGGIFRNNEMQYAIEIPFGLSLLGKWDPNAEIKGLAEVPEEDRPPVNIVHLSFQTMVGAGFALLGLSAWLGLAWRRRRDIPATPWFLRFAALSGVAAVVAMEAGWITTEVGRQPWIAWGVMRTADAVNPAPGLRVGLYGVILVYTVLTIGTVYVMRRLASDKPVPVAPQERDADEYEVV